MRKIICLTIAVIMLLVGVTALAQEPSDRGVPVTDDKQAVSAELIAALEMEKAAAIERIESGDEQSGELIVQEKAFDGFVHGSYNQSLEIEVYVFDTSVVVGEEIYIEVHYDSPYTPITMVKTELLSSPAFKVLGDTGMKTGTSNYTDGYFHWSYTPTQAGNVSFVISIMDDAGNIVSYSTPTVMVTAYDNKPYEGLVADGGLSALLTMEDTAISVGETTKATFGLNSDEESILYLCYWTLTDFDGVVIDDSQEKKGVVYPASGSKTVSFSYTPTQPGYLRFALTAFTENGDMVNTNSSLITVYPYIDVSLDKEDVMFGETVKASCDVTWPGKSSSLRGYWTFTDENGKKTTKNVSMSSGSSVNYVTDKPGTLQFTAVVTRSGKEYTRSTEAIPVYPYNISVSVDKTTVPFGGEVTANYAVKWYKETPTVEAYWRIEASDFNMRTWETVETNTGSFTYEPTYGKGVRFYVLASVGEEEASRYSDYVSFTGTPLRSEPVHTDGLYINQSSATIGKPITGYYEIDNYTGAEDGYYYVEWQVLAGDQQYDYTYYDDELPGTSGTLSFTPLFGDQVRLYVYAHDLDFWVYNSTDYIPIHGEPEFDPPQVTVTLDKSQVKTGETITATYQVTGGPEDMEVSVEWYATDGDNYQTIHTEENLPLSGKHTLTVPYGPTIYCEVWLSHPKLPNGYYYGTSKEVSVSGDPIYQINLSLDKTSVMAGDTITATYSCIGYPDGTPSVYWYFYDEEGEQISSSRGSIPDAMSGTSTVFVPYGREVMCSVYMYHDTLPHASAEKSAKVTGYAVYDPVKITASLDKTTVQSGKPLTLTYNVTGGKAPLEVEMYASTYDDTGYWSIADRTLQTSGREIITPYLGDTVSISIYVTDADGNEVTWYAWEEHGDIKLTGAPEPQETRLTVSADKSTVVVGEPITVTYNFSTGNVPLGEGCYYYWSVSVDDGTGYSTLLERGEITQKSGTITYVPQMYEGESLYFGMYVRNVYGQEHYNWDIEALIVGDGSRFPGDADDNGKVNTDDVLLMLQYIQGEKPEIKLTNAEVNGDGRVNYDDALRVMQYLAGWDVALK